MVSIRLSLGFTFHINSLLVRDYEPEWIYLLGGFVDLALNPEESPFNMLLKSDFINNMIFSIN